MLKNLPLNALVFPGRIHAAPAYTTRLGVTILAVGLAAHPAFPKLKK